MAYVDSGAEALSLDDGRAEVWCDACAPGVVPGIAQPGDQNVSFADFVFAEFSEESHGDPGLIISSIFIESDVS